MSFDTGDRFTGQCRICLKDTEQAILWVGVLCTACKTCADPWGEWAGSIARKRREVLGLTRREMSALTGYSPKTIKQYEFVRCSEAYYEATALAVWIVQPEGTPV